MHELMVEKQCGHVSRFCICIHLYSGCIPRGQGHSQVYSKDEENERLGSQHKIAWARVKVMGTQGFPACVIVGSNANLAPIHCQNMALARNANRSTDLSMR